ncbi:MAG TPA: TMEM175 family protein [Gaiellales bacterium]|nr:TMEM175 family protein [Gaiellales bacterium]
MATNRLEAFSDGVFAIAITLLVLEIRVPTNAGDRLAHELADQWPAYVAYLVSFLVIGIIWMNHHAVIDHLRAVDRPLVGLNLFLLLWVALIPWPTRLVAEYMREGGVAERVAALVYAGTMTMMGIAFGLLWRYASSDRRLLGSGLSDADIARRTRRFTIGAPIYAIALIVALVSAPASLAIIAVLAVYYALPQGGMMRGPSE